MNHLTPVLFFLVILITSCVDGQKDYPKPNAASDLRNTIMKSDKVFVYEGLPHQMFESDLLKSEKKEKDTTTIAVYPFYTPKTQVEGGVISTLKTIISDSGNYTQFTGEKLCGGFHPDYAVEWSDGDNRYSILLCYGCSEVLLLDGKRSYRYDFRFTDKLKKLLSTYSSKRPKLNKAN